ncbi:MAG: hypothetical protein IAE78_03480 [Myxococcus sp.]|nr:hypothetical protein [Myxococcus sp.]
MSLFFHRRGIEAAVAGVLDADEETALRAHLSRCEVCRAHYDALVLSSRAVTGSQEPTADELRRERARLQGLLAGGPVGRTPSRRRTWLLLPVAVAAAALALVVVNQPTEREVTERGGVAAPLAPFSLSLYAKPQAGDAPVRLVAEFPASGEATLSTTDWVQLTSKAAVVVVLVGPGGARLFPAGASQSLPAGTWRLFAVQGVTEAAALAAAKEATATTRRLPLANPQVTGVLSVRP